MRVRVNSIPRIGAVHAFMQQDQKEFFPFFVRETASIAEPHWNVNITDQL
jgi:hypothetical protein